MTNTDHHSAVQHSNVMRHARLGRLPFQSWLQRLVPRPFDWVLVFLYSAVLLNFIVLSCYCGFSSLEVIGISGAVITLLLLDRWEHAHLGTSPSLRTAVGVFVLRVALIEAVAQID